MEWVGGGEQPSSGWYSFTASPPAPVSLSYPCPLGASSPEHGLGTREATSQPAPSPPCSFTSQDPSLSLQQLGSVLVVRDPLIS